MNFDKKFLVHVKAGARVIQMVSYELQRVHGFVNYAATQLGREWYVWNRVEGLKKWESERNFLEEQDGEMRNPEFVLDFFMDHEDPLLLILEDFHPDLTEDKVATIKRIRNIAQQSTAHDKTLILGQPFYFLPKELEKEVQLMEVPLPSIADIAVIFEEVCKKYDLSGNRVEKTDNLIEAALGLTIMEAEIAFAKAAVEKGRLTEAEIPLVIAEKESVIKKSGFLEYYHPHESLEDVGGLEKLKSWLERRGNAFGSGAKDYGLDTPKGVLLLGIPGTGKSLSAKAIANVWKFPLLRLDIGKVFGGIVGESERNIREALKIAETIAPSILWIDEIEKGLAGMTGSASSDAGQLLAFLGHF